MLTTSNISSVGQWQH